MHKEHLLELKKLLSDKNFSRFDQRVTELKDKIEPHIIYNYNGYKHLLQNQIDTAIQCFESSIELKEEFDSFLNLGACFLKINQFEKSFNYLKKSLELNKKFEDTYILIAKAKFGLNQNSLAYKYLKEGLKNCRDQNKLNFEIGVNSIKTKDFYQGIVSFNKILKKNKNNFNILNFLGVCFEQLSQIDIAEKYFLESIKINPKFSEGICNLANLLRGRGNFDSAKVLYRRALEIGEKKNSIYRYLSTITNFKEDNELLTEMTSYMNSQNFKSSIQKEELYFAIFKAYDEKGSFNESKKYLLHANNEVSNKNKYNHNYTSQHFSIIKKIFNAEFIKKHSVDQLDGAKVIFIVGMPRSGTTLVEQIISSHSSVFSGGELFYLQKHLKEAFPNNNFIDFENDVQSNFLIKKNQIGKKYIDDLKSISQLTVTDKLPFNFIFLGFIKSIFKDVKIIHCKRDPMEVCFSIYKNYFAFEDIKFAYNQNDLVSYFKEYKSLMNHWYAMFGSEIYNIEYNNLINNQEKETRKLLKYCELSWEDQCLEFYKNKSNVQSLSTSQVRKPIYKGSLESWKKYEDILGDLIKGLA